MCSLFELFFVSAMSSNSLDVLIVLMFLMFQWWHCSEVILSLCSVTLAQGGTPEHDTDLGGWQEAAEELDECLERLDLGAAAAI